MSDTVFFFVTLALAIGLIGTGMWYFGMYKDYSGNKRPEDLVSPKKEDNNGI